MSITLRRALNTNVQQRTHKIKETEDKIMPTPSIGSEKLNEIRQFLMDNVDDCADKEALFNHARAKYSEIFDEQGVDGQMNRVWLNEAAIQIWRMNLDDKAEGEGVEDKDDDDADGDDDDADGDDDEDEDEEGGDDDDDDDDDLEDDDDDLDDEEDEA